MANELKNLEFHLRIALHNREVSAKRLAEWDQDIEETAMRIVALKSNG